MCWVTDCKDGESDPSGSAPCSTTGVYKGYNLNQRCLMGSMSWLDNHEACKTAPIPCTTDLAEEVGCNPGDIISNTDIVGDITNPRHIPAETKKGNMAAIFSSKDFCNFRRDAMGGFCVWEEEDLTSGCKCEQSLSYEKEYGGAYRFKYRPHWTGANTEHVQW